MAENGRGSEFWLRVMEKKLSGDPLTPEEEERMAWVAVEKEPSHAAHSPIVAVKGKVLVPSNGGSGIRTAEELLGGKTREDLERLVECRKEELGIGRNEEAFRCLVCGRKMVERTGKFGEFLACSGFPSCWWTTPMVTVNEFLNINADRSPQRRLFDILKEATMQCPKCYEVALAPRMKRGGGPNSLYLLCKHCKWRKSIARLATPSTAEIPTNVSAPSQAGQCFSVPDPPQIEEKAREIVNSKIGEPLGLCPECRAPHRRVYGFGGCGKEKRPGLWLKCLNQGCYRHKGAFEVKSREELNKLNACPFCGGPIDRMIVVREGGVSIFILSCKRFDMFKDGDPCQFAAWWSPGAMSDKYPSGYGGNKEEVEDAKPSLLHSGL